MRRRYEIGDVIGRGGNAIVYEAVDRQTMMRVALKVLDSLDHRAERGVAIARLEREGRLARAINHPNVCKTLDCGVLEDGRPFVAMELLEGETLRTYLSRRGGRLNPERAIAIGSQILAGLDAAHELRVVHRDIKPENIFIEWKGDQGSQPLSVKILDFGVCRRVLDPLDDRTLTLVGCVVGTPGYLAPEQAYGERALDPRVDIFAVGLILFEALSGRAAYLSRQTTELSRALAQRLPSLRSLSTSIPRVLERVIEQATEPEPRMRYATAAKFQHDLLEARTAIRREEKRLREKASSLARSFHGLTPRGKSADQPSSERSF
jgi:eukaryotic-like serine/threonine-protein kinase